jgi:hypothetical protein
MNSQEYNAGQGSEEEAIEFEREHVQAQLRKRDDPFDLLEEMTPLLGGTFTMPSPAYLGQTLVWTGRTHFCGRIATRKHLKALLYQGRLEWAVYKPGRWL